MRELWPRREDREAWAPRTAPVPGAAGGIQPWATWVPDGPAAIAVFFTTAAPDTVDGAEAVEGDDAVTITVRVDGPGTAPGSERTRWHVIVALSAPLGGREVRDGATGEPRPRWAPQARAG